MDKMDLYVKVFFASLVFFVIASIGGAIVKEVYDFKVGAYVECAGLLVPTITVVALLFTGKRS